MQHRRGAEWRARGGESDPFALHGIHRQQGSDLILLRRVYRHVARIPAEEFRTDVQNDVSGLLTGAGRTQAIPQMRECHFPLLGSDPLGNVSSHTHQAQGAPFGALDQRSDKRDGELRSVLPVAEDIALPAATQRLLQSDVIKPRRVLIRIEKFGRSAHDLLGGISVATKESLVGKGEAVLLVRNVNHLPSALYRVGQEPDLFLGPLAFRDINNGANQSGHLAFGILKSSRVEYDFAARAVGISHRTLVNLNPWLLQQRLIGLVVDLGQVLWGNVVNRLSKHLRSVQSQVLLEGAIASQIPAGSILVEDGVRNCVDQCLQEQHVVPQGSDTARQGCFESLTLADIAGDRHKPGGPACGVRGYCGTEFNRETLAICLEQRPLGVEQHSLGQRSCDVCPDALMIFRPGQVEDTLLEQL